MPTKAHASRAKVLPPPAPPAEKWAFGYLEGQQYTHIKILGCGQEGTISLVRGVADGKFYCRKRSWTSYQEGVGLAQPLDPEIAFQQPLSHPGIAKLFYSTQTISHDAKRRFLSLYFEYCNLGDLDSLSSLCGDGQQMPELRIWRCFDRLFDSVVFLHLQRGVQHNDITTSNILVNLEPGNKFPDFYLSDFGVSKKLLGVSEKGHAGGEDDEECVGPQAQVLTDLFDVKKVIITMAGGDNNDLDAVADVYSRDLVRALEMLKDLTENIHFNWRNYRPAALQNFIDDSAQRCFKRSDKDLDLSWMVPTDAYDQEETFTSAALLENADTLPPGPWVPRKIDPMSWRPIGKTGDKVPRLGLRCKPLRTQ